jgi:hypothetical protein
VRFMRYLLIFMFSLCLNKAQAHPLYLSDYAPQSAYDTREYVYSYKRKSYKKPASLNKMAYKNPTAALIFNHPAKGMKHPRHEALRLTHGVPQRKILYPYYELRDRPAPQEWFVR